MNTKRAVALLSLDTRPLEHERAVQQLLAEKIAALLGIPVEASAGEQSGHYWIPSETVIGPQQMHELGIHSGEDFFGGAVLFPFMATKAISHPLIERPTVVPTGWNERFHQQAAHAVLRGTTVFDLADAERAGTALLSHGPVRVKAVRGKAGRGQTLVENPADLVRCLDEMDAQEVAEWGLVLEEHLKEVVTFSVGHVEIAGITASYYGSQRLTRDDGGAEVYGGSDLMIVRGDYSALGALSLTAHARLAIDQAVAYERAAFDCLGLVASRRNYDIAQGIDALGEERSGVLEQSWRIGGASAAEIFALEAFHKNPEVTCIKASTYETYGQDAPEGGQCLFKGEVPPHGTISKFVKVELNACP